MRIYQISLLTLLLTLGCALSGAGQSVAEPAWYSRLENSLKKTKPAWSIDSRRKSFDGVSASMTFRVEAEKNYASVDIFWPGFGDIPNAIDSFNGSKIIYGNSAAPGTIQREIKDFGDEATAWLNKSGGWKRLHFRREKAIVQISGSAEILIREVAALIDSEIKKS